MKIKKIFLIKLTLASFMLLIFQAVIFSQKIKQVPEKTTISSYEILIQTFDKPITRIDDKGEKIKYEKAYVIKLMGNIDVSGAIPVDIYIGDYKIPEYGGTKDGIYFKIYDEKLLKDLENKPFGYGFQKRKIKTFDLKFRPSSKKPFKKYEKDIKY